MAKPIISKDCIACGICVDGCPTSALDIRGEKAMLVNEDECIGCGDCEENCPMGAIEMSDEED